MKKETTLRLCTAIAMAMMLMVSCTKDRHRGGGDDEGYGTATGKHIVQETSIGANGDTIVHKYIWNNTQLQRIISSYADVSFNYNGSRLMSFTYHYNDGSTLTVNLSYSEERLASVSYTIYDSIEERYDFEYNAEGEISTMMLSTSKLGVMMTTRSFSLTWQDGNLIEKRDQDGNYDRYQYDTHPTAYSPDIPAAYFLLFAPALISANNITAVESTTTSGRELSYSRWTYTSDGHPASRVLSGGGITYYLYADGDGSTGAGSGGTPIPDGPDISTTLAGTYWQWNNSIFLSFETLSEGTYIYGYSNPFTYTYSDGKGTMQMNGETYTLQLSENNSLYLYQPSADAGWLFVQAAEVQPTLAGTSWSYSEIGDGWSESFYIDFRTAEQGYVSYTFRDSYSGQHNNTTNNFTYTYSDNHGVIVYDDNNYTSEFTINGDTLIWNQHIFHRTGA